jgi:hypothetical protein
MSVWHLHPLVETVRAANKRGHLYPRPDSEATRSALALLTRKGVLTPVPGTAVSLPGYLVAEPSDDAS